MVFPRILCDDISSSDYGATDKASFSFSFSFLCLATAITGLAFIFLVVAVAFPWPRHFLAAVLTSSSEENLVPDKHSFICEKRKLSLGAKSGLYGVLYHTSHLKLCVKSGIGQVVWDLEHTTSLSDLKEQHCFVTCAYCRFPINFIGWAVNFTCRNIFSP
ncbi:hypothetical protein AVEN_187441-1 [Araneus ventricosus]|uniref:Uncharacterized protein n=1 Tax=Araneus ventricosus TaxID=182803 RepID=A0A4Y2BRT2_ARAVE|nr:hypothetical protein AVEN_187441-1 [Araneus ventricosus]